MKDVVAHLTHYERRLADRLHEQLRGEPCKPAAIDAMSDDAPNHTVFDREPDEQD